MRKKILDAKKWERQDQLNFEVARAINSQAAVIEQIRKQIEDAQIKNRVRRFYNGLFRS